MEKAFTSRNFSKAELDSALLAAIEASDCVAPILQARFGSGEYQTKTSERDWVTQWDTWAEEVIKERLDAFSNGEIAFCAEESGVSGVDLSRDVYWTVDPIDGTSQFVRGNPFCTTMIALVDQGTPVASVIHDFVHGDIYTAVSGGGAQKNLKERLSVSSRPIRRAYVELETNEDTSKAEEIRRAIRHVGGDLVQSNACGFAFLSVARGSNEGVVSINNPYGTEWDMAPGSLLVHEAGGIVRNIGKESYSVKDFDLVAANPSVFAVLEELMRERH